LRIPSGRESPEDYSAVPSCDGGAFRLLSWSYDFRFPPKLPLTCVMFRFALQTSTTLRTLSVFFYAGRSLLARALRPVRASSASCHLSSLLRAIPSGIRSRSPCGFLSGNLLHGFFAVTWRGVGAISRITNQSFNQNTSGVLSSPCGHSLFRGKISFENFPELANLTIFDLLLQHSKEHLAPFGRPTRIGLLLAGLNPDPSVVQILRPVRFGFQFS